MAFLPGGSADKLGNRYEHLWTAYRVADILEGKASSIRIEPPGSGGAGIEFLIEERDATWAEQVKSDSRRWTLHRLGTESVLDNLKLHVERGRWVRLVVASDANELKGLADRSRAAETLAEFVGEALSRKQVGDLQALAERWALTEEACWQLLQRVWVEHHPFEGLERLVGARYALLFSDPADLVVNELRGLLEANLQTMLAPPGIWSHLIAQGLNRRLIAGDQNVITALRRTVDRHQRKVSAAAPGIVAARTETDQLTDLLRHGPAHVVVVDGRAGSGKSTIVADALRRLTEAGWHAAVVRMDSIDPSARTAAAIGRAADLLESPVVLLAGVSQGQPAVLIIDQLDAASMYSGRTPDVFDAVEELLEEAQGVPNLKIALVARSVDVDNDPRLRQLVSAGGTAERFTVGLLEPEAVRAAVQQSGTSPDVLDPHTLELCRVPLHLAVLTRLPDDARQERYLTLPDLYERLTREVRRSVEGRLGSLDWNGIVAQLVSHLSDHEVLTAPAAVLDEFSPAEIGALGSSGILVKDDTRIGFLHETYFDFLFALGFVAAGDDLHDFLSSSGQHLFRRAQTRQVLEYFAGVDRERFRHSVVELLSSDQIRAHLCEVVVGVLGQLDAEPADWEAIEELAWSGLAVGDKILRLLTRPRWFDAADGDGRWEQWLTDPDEERVDRVVNVLVHAARDRPQRVEELVRPHLASTVAWRNRIRALIEWSLVPALTDLAVELTTRGDLDDARGPIAVNSDFWSIINHLLHAGDPAAAARLIGAYLQRALERARADGSADPFRSGHLARNSPAAAHVIHGVVDGAPLAYIKNVLPFVRGIVEATSSDRDGDETSTSTPWRLRFVDNRLAVHDALFHGLDDALRRGAEEEPDATAATVLELAQAPAEELRFLACRAYSKLGPPDEAVEWLLSDPENLGLGWSDSPHWATRELILATASSCSDETLGRLTATILSYEPEWERRPSARRLRGRAQYELLSAIPDDRLSPSATRRFGELNRKFDEPPTPPRAIRAQMVGSPIPQDAAERMTDEDWIRAFTRYKDTETEWRSDQPVGGARELAQVFGHRVSTEPERFARLLLTFTSDMPPQAFGAVIDNIADKVHIGLFEEVCAHAAATVGSGVRRRICSALQKRAEEVTEMSLGLLEQYSTDPDPERELARATAPSSGPSFGGDLAMAGLNSTRGQVAHAAAAILWRNPDHVDRVVPVVTRLASDPIMAVRVSAAEAILPLLNHRPDAALDLAETLLATAASDIYESWAVAQLLIYCLIRDPTRFAGQLNRALTAHDAAAERGGAAWAVMTLRETIPGETPTEVTQLSEAARKGAASVFADNPSDGDQLEALFNDATETVRREAASAMRNLDRVPTAQHDRLIRLFLHSSAFDDNFDGLVYALDQLTTKLPAAAILVAERIAEVAASELGDIRTSRAAVSTELIRVVLRLYRQGDEELRVRCLDVIDRLAESGAHGLTESLADER